MRFAHNLNRGHILLKEKQNKNHSKHGTKYIYQLPLHARVCYLRQKSFCEFFVNFDIKRLLKRKNVLNHFSHTKSSSDLVKHFEKGHKSLNGYLENKRRDFIIKSINHFEWVVRVR